MARYLFLTEVDVVIHDGKSLTEAVEAFHAEWPEIEDARVYRVVGKLRKVEFREVTEQKVVIS